MAGITKPIARWLRSFVLCLLACSPAPAWAETTSDADSPFPLLPGLEKSVDFWKRIFTEFSLSQLVFFDPLDMSKIYEVLDVGEEHRGRDYIDDQRARVAATHGVDIERVRIQRGTKERTAAGLKRSGRYIEQMQEIFRERGLPAELTYLPIVESSYELKARSHAGAQGIWQFMRRTGKEFRLRVGRAIDERKDPLESTRAAAALLAQNHQVLGNWPLAITAYNYGQTGIARAVAEIESDNLVELIRRYDHRHWGFPSKNFYAEFLAAVDIAKNVNHYFPDLELDPPSPIKEVEFKKRASLSTVLKATGLTKAQFYEWNPAFAPSTRFIPAGYRVKMPAEKSEPDLVEVANGKQEKTLVRHRVKRGETISHIARRYGASVDEILKINRIRAARLLRAGTTLLIPKL
ncbi:MAG: transglycosylase SLT domain-containing protein [Candidatus Binatia bacterium]